MIEGASKVERAAREGAHGPRMTPGPERRRASELFTVRLWLEPVGDGVESRGSVRHVVTGETRHFRDWSGLVAFFEDVLEGAQTPSGEEKR